MNIEQLAMEVLKAEESSANQQIKNLWQGEEKLMARLHRHGEPKAGAFPFTVGIELQMWAKILDFGIETFFTSPSVHFEVLLKMMLYHFEEIKDDTPVTTDLLLSLGVGFEASIFGLKQHFSKGTDPWVGREPLIQKESDLSSMKIPDFYEGGVMPEIHQFYKTMASLAEAKGFKVIFPRFTRGPFGVAVALRGFQPLLMDIIERPAFVHALMEFVTETRIEWERERANFFGIEIEKGDLWNDEIDSSLMSPVMYEEFVLPYEIKLCDFHRGIRYWHSCADVTGFIAQITKIPAIDILDVGPWTDLETTLKITQGKIPLEVRPHPKRINIYAASQKDMLRVNEGIISACKSYHNEAFAIRASSLQTTEDLTSNLEKIRLWTELTRNQTSTLRQGRG